MGYEFTTQQRKALACVTAEPALQTFYLTGGTALAAHYLAHRISDDLDFFTADPIDSITLDACIERFKHRLGAAAISYQKIHDRRLYSFSFTTAVPPLKIEFVYYPFAQLAAARMIDGVRVDSLRDIAANKLMALIDRFEPKDFVDLYFIAPQRPLADIRTDAEKKFGVRIDPLTLGAELMKVDRVAALPNMLKPLTVAELKEYVHGLVRELKGDIVAN